MSAHAAAMSETRSAPAKTSGFFRRLMGCVLYVLVIAGFFALFQRYQENLSQDLMTVFAILAVGLAAGSATRSSFYGWPGWVHFFVVLVILLFGMIALGFFTNWQIGLGPLKPWLDGKVDAEQLLHLGGGLIVSAISLAAWRKPRLKVRHEALVYSQTHHRRKAERTPSLPPQPGRHVRVLRGNSSKHAQGVRGSGWFQKIRGLPKFHGSRERTAEKLSLSVDRKRFRPGFQRMFKRKPNVNLALVEIHRCPYCLEEVKLSDPRGVKKCEVCNTLHHTDCWDVTGECQVPHLNA